MVPNWDFRKFLLQCLGRLAHPPAVIPQPSQGAIAPAQASELGLDKNQSLVATSVPFLPTAWGFSVFYKAAASPRTCTRAPSFWFLSSASPSCPLDWEALVLIPRSQFKQSLHLLQPCSTTMDCVSFPRLCVLEKHIMYNGPTGLYGNRNNTITTSRWGEKNRYPLLQQKWKALLRKKKGKQLPVWWDKEPGHPDPHIILEENIARSSRVRDALLQNTVQQGGWHNWHSVPQNVLQSSSLLL